MIDNYVCKARHKFELDRKFGMPMHINSKTFKINSNPEVLSSKLFLSYYLEGLTGKLIFFE